MVIVNTTLYLASPCHYTAERWSKMGSSKLKLSDCFKAVTKNWSATKISPAWLNLAAKTGFFANFYALNL